MRVDGLAHMVSPMLKVDEVVMMARTRQFVQD